MGHSNGALGAKACRNTFERGPQLVDFMNIGERNLGDGKALVRLSLDKSVRLQVHKCFAENGATHTGKFTKFPLDQFVPGPKHAIQDGGSNPVLHLGPQGFIGSRNVELAAVDQGRASLLTARQIVRQYCASQRMPIHALSARRTWLQKTAYLAPGRVASVVLQTLHKPRDIGCDQDCILRVTCAAAAILQLAPIAGRHPRRVSEVKVNLVPVAEKPVPDPAISCPDLSRREFCEKN